MKYSAYEMFGMIVKFSVEADSTEMSYEKRIKLAMERLGWKEEKGNISFQERVSIGANGSVIPDAVLSHNGEREVVIELKRPTDSLGNKYNSQITSYMKQLRLDFGILIGERIQLYYDNPNDRKEEPILIFESPFVLVDDHAESERLINLLIHDNFSVENLRQFCEEKLKLKEEEEEVQKVVSQLEEAGEDMVLELLRRDLKQNTLTDEMIEKVLENIVVNIQSKKEYGNEMDIIEQNMSPLGQQKLERYNGPALPIEFIPKNEDLFKRLLLEKKYAIREYHYEEDRPKREIWNAQNFTETSGLRGNIRSMPIARKGKWKEQGIEKVVFIIDGYEFKDIEDEE